jgi:hypothetical protein
MIRITRLSAPSFVPGLAVAALAIGLASCAPKPAPPPPPPPPPPVIVPTPPKPTPPDGASLGIYLPPADASGLRQSVNRNISPTQMLWNLRSAYNVAALNCNSPVHAAILPRYKVFLTTHSKALVAANKKVDAEFKGKYGAKFIAPREQYMTSVYNHFALPPTLPNFCDAVMAVSKDGELVKSAELEAFAIRSLPSIEVVFDDFYRRYEKYRNDLAAWEARYGPPPAPATTSVSYAPVVIPAMGTTSAGSASYGPHQ